jgi:argininosuccinate lyase
MPSYTHLQRAEPVLVAHWLMAYFEMAMRDITRLKDARARMNFCPLGSGPIAGATLKLDRTIAAKELGFTAPTANSMDATSDRDFALEFSQTAATIGLHLSRFAEEITLHATAEFGFIELPEAFSTGSSAMPPSSKDFRWPTTRTCRRRRKRPLKSRKRWMECCLCWLPSRRHFSFALIAWRMPQHTAT